MKQRQTICDGSKGKKSSYDILIHISSHIDLPFLRLGRPLLCLQSRDGVLSHDAHRIFGATRAIP